MGENIEAKNQPKDAAKNKIVRQEDDLLNLAIRAHQNCESQRHFFLDIHTQADWPVYQKGGIAEMY